MLIARGAGHLADLVAAALPISWTAWRPVGTNGVLPRRHQTSDSHPSPGTILRAGVLISARRRRRAASH